MSSRAYDRAKPDFILMAVTSQRRAASLGEVEVRAWQEAGLLKPSVIKPVLTTVEKRMVVRRLGRLVPALDTHQRRQLRLALAGDGDPPAGRAQGADGI